MLGLSLSVENTTRPE